VAVLVFFLTVTLVAAYLPARRASRLDPATALQCEQGLTSQRAARSPPSSGCPLLRETKNLVQDCAHCGGTDFSPSAICTTSGGPYLV
jgi:hypothetical protein